MAESSEQQGGEYLYAFTQNDAGGDLGPIGLEGSVVRRLSIVPGELAALVSTISRPRVRPERRNLAAHNAVLKRAMEESTVLPVAFGVVAADEAELLSALTTNRSDLLSQLLRVRGKVEMGLRLTWDVPNLFEYFVNTHTELRVARDALADPRHARRDEMIELGRLFERVLNEERDRHFERVAEIIERQGIEVVRNAARNEREVLNLACLIPRDNQDDFERIVTDAASGFDSSYTFDFNGPWAPHHFVSLNLKL